MLVLARKINRRSDYITPAEEGPTISATGTGMGVCRTLWFGYSLTIAVADFFYRTGGAFASTPRAPGLTVFRETVGMRRPPQPAPAPPLLRQPSVRAIHTRA